MDAYYCIVLQCAFSSSSVKSNERVLQHVQMEVLHADPGRCRLSFRPDPDGIKDLILHMLVVLIVV